VYATEVRSATGAEAPAIVTIRLRDGLLREPYVDTLVAQGGKAPYAWSLTEGSLPAGLSLEGATGKVSGQPQQGGLFSFTAQVVDANARTNRRVVALQVLASDLPRITVGDVSVTEGQSGTTSAVFTAVLSRVSGEAVSASWATANGLATAGSDYTAASGQLTIPAGQTTGTIVVTVLGDTVPEGDETFLVKFSHPSGAVVEAEAVGTIRNDDIAPSNTLSINDAEVLEGNTGAATASLTVTLTPAAAGTVTVQWATADGTATAGTDYTAGSATLTFAAGETTKTIGVSAIGDTQIEGDETFVVNLSNASGAAIQDAQGQVRILNDDSATHALPFGVVDTPVEGAAGVEGAIGVTGWALDDTGVQRLIVSRDPVAPEPAGSRIYIGDGVFVSGARPDVAAAYPGYPNASRAGWGYMLLTNMLPSQGNGVFKLWLHAQDREGQQGLLGTRTITCGNSVATRPFGTLDTPGQGGTVSGSASLVWGWALTPQPGVIPTDGSTIWLYVDGVPVGHPTYNLYRVDIATLFPGYANTDGAVGYSVLDTTALTNGIHTIAWLVTDDRGRAEGLGSRYFWVAN
jgi:hypothetical protein